MVRESESGETGRERYSRNYQSRLKRRSNRKKSFYLKMTFKRKSSLTFLSSLSSSSLPSSLMSLLLSLWQLSLSMTVHQNFSKSSVAQR